MFRIKKILLYILLIETMIFLVILYYFIELFGK